MAAAAAAAGAAYRQPGPYRTYQLNPITIRVGGDDELPITTTIQMTMPIGAPSPARLVVLSAGFLLNASLYESYATDLAAWGYAVALYDVSEVMDDAGTVAAIQRILDTCLGGDAQLRPLIDARAGAALVGHSRGAKLSCLVAAASPSRVSGLMLLDPVDNTPMTPAGEGYPSSLPGLSRISPNIPVLVVGAGAGGDVVPEAANYKRFVAACRGPVWSVELQGAGHLAFLDKEVGLFTLFSAPGPTPDAFVRAASKVALLTWLQHAVFPASQAACAQAVRAADAEISRMVKGEAKTMSARLPSTPSSSSTSSASTSSANAGQGTNGGRAPTGQRAASLVTESVDELMGRRARELKAMLVERGIKCDDCFEKEQLVQRIMETCKVPAR